MEMISIQVIRYFLPWSKISGWPYQAFVKVVMKTVTPEATAFARDIKLEFAELDRLVDIHVVAE